METKKQFLKECFLQKTNQFDALEFLPDELPLGKELFFGVDAKIDPTKIPIVVEKDQGEDAKIIGILSEEDSKDIKPYFYAGWAGDLFQCRISRYNADADENKRFSIAIHIKEKGANAEVQGPAQEGGDPNGT